jgi:hypothetical protein
MVVKYRALLAESRLVVGTFVAQIFNGVHHAPYQQETHAQKQEQNDCNIHGKHRALKLIEILESAGLLGL